MFPYSFHYATLQDNCEGIPALFFYSWCYPFNGDDYQSQFIDLCQDAVQGGLMVHRSLEDSLAILWADGKAIEPVRPGWVNHPLDTDTIAGWLVIIASVSHRVAPIFLGVFPDLIIWKN
jgi:hypothetical protein